MASQTTAASDESERLTDDDEDAEMTVEERMAFLRARGVLIEDPKEMLAGKKAQPAPTGDKFTFLFIPQDPNEPVANHSGVAEPGRDALKELVGPLFADQAALDSRVVERETSAQLAGMMTGSDLKAPSAGTIQRLAQPGGAEAYPLAQPTVDNRWCAVRMYIDEVGALRQRPLNVRASKLAESAGLGGLSIHGDAFVGRIQTTPKGLCNVDFDASEMAPDAAWSAMARASHSNAYDAVPEKEKEMKSAEADGYSWTQTTEDLEVRVRDLPESSKALSKRVKVSYGKGEELAVTLDGLTVLFLAPLFAPVSPDECSWSVDGKELVITMEKRAPREWGNITLSGNT